MIIAYNLSYHLSPSSTSRLGLPLLPGTLIDGKTRLFIWTRLDYKSRLDAFSFLSPCSSFPLCSGPLVPRRATPPLTYPTFPQISPCHVVRRLYRSSTPCVSGSSLAMLLGLPGLLWRWYLEYLWSPEPNSWVANVARTFRILALLTIAPFALLTLLVRCQFGACAI